MQSLAVFCGSRMGHSGEFADAARALGQLLAEQGKTLVYGGGRVGLMGTVADACLGAGGRVIGVIPQALLDKEVGHRGLTELHVVRDMHERKAMMAQLADGFVALPGGAGTLEEFAEVWTWAMLGYHHKPIGLLNVKGFYRPLLELATGYVDEGFLDQRHQAMLVVESDPQALLARFDHYQPPRNKWD
ncbi:TIGR00730 family Rossman fold protein [Gallaecimonas xiamenensis]|uniref:Cytokinin riboside 5'-monophosphate phosphoribohydrolase n=1 Tax=Gallaecimonas xiamenensis 3-C-1 TaxID=745411 RepID=K2J264_9GAMM|nr:TIGR00730 family Rossman fold protein [Gallaecimonas xiamenensis]EKE69148.1 putative Rossmann fold nucleotide-binding protein [Gallaecimonas xiamenensis 3-C-1]